MPPSERRNNYVRQTETGLGSEALGRRGVSRICPRVTGMKVTMQTSLNESAGEKGIGIHGDARNVGSDSQAGGSVVICMPGHWWDVIIRPAPFVIGQKENGVFVRRAGHERVNHIRNRGLAVQDGLARSRVLVSVAISWLDPCEVREGASLKILKILCNWHNVSGVNAEIIV